MADKVPPKVRSRIMAQVKSKGMKPEMKVRRLLHGLGYRYRLHRKDLPGRPDLVFPSRRKVVFVNGCFWHLHDGCANVRIPATNRGYWLTKLERNHARDVRNLAALSDLGGSRTRSGSVNCVTWNPLRNDWSVSWTHRDCPLAQ